MLHKNDDQLEVGLFLEIENFTTPALSVCETGFVSALKKERITLRPYTIRQALLFKNLETLSFIISGIYRYVIYPVKAKKWFIKDGVNHVSNAAYANLLLLAPSGCRTIVHFHDFTSWLPKEDRAYKLHRGGWFRHFLVRTFKGAGVKKAHYLVAVSEYNRQEVIKYLNVSPDKISVVHNGVDHGIFKLRDKKQIRQELNIALDKKLILSVASKEPRKNIERLIESIPVIAEKISNLYFIHVGGLSEESMMLLRKYGLKDKSRTFNNLSHDALSLYYNAADVFVFPSSYEGFGLPVVEAMASGCPVVASDRTSLPELLQGAGILLNAPTDPSCIAQEVIKVLSDDRLQKEMSEKGLERAKAFSWEKTAKKLVSIYRYVLQKPPNTIYFK